MTVSETNKRIPPIVGQLYANIKTFGSSAQEDDAVKGETLTPVMEDANLITSSIADNVLMHKVVLDIDLPAKLVPSSTPDHYHLYIDHAIPWETYLKLLHVMAECGLLEEGYVGASERRGYTGVRLPWVRKEPRDRPLGHHEWSVESQFCVCGHEIGAHRSEMEDNEFVAMVCTVAGCDDPDDEAKDQAA